MKAKIWAAYEYRKVQNLTRSEMTGERDIEIEILASTVDVVEEFCSVGSVMTSIGSCDKGYQTRIGKANNVGQ